MRGARAKGAAALFLALLCSRTALAGAWTEKKGHGEIITTLAISRADRAFDPFGETRPAASFAKEDYEVYGEYGLSDRLTAVLNLRYTSLHPDPPSNGANGLGEAAIGFRQRLLVSKRGAVISLQATGFMPGATGLTSGGFDGELRLLVGSSFRLWRRPGFLNAELAYRMRANGFSDELREDATLGIDVARRWTVLLQAFGTFTVTPGRTQSFEGEETKLELSVLYRLSPRWQVQLGGEGVVRGTNVPDERAILTAVWYRF